MQELLKKVKESSVYEILKEQSAIIILSTTLLGSLLSLSSKLYQYMYLLGRFRTLEIPKYFINITDFSFGDIFSNFATILCFAAAVAIMIAIIMYFRVALWKSRVRNKYLRRTKEYVKSVIDLSITIIGGIFFVVTINTVLIILLYELDIISFIIVLSVFIISEFLLAQRIIKDQEIKRKSISKSENEKQRIENELEFKMADDEFAEYNSEKDTYNKKHSISNWITLLTLPFLLISILGIYQYQLGKDSANNSMISYQIFDVEKGENRDKCKVVLDKCKEGYIVADAYISGEGESVILEIDQHNQQVISIVNLKYENKHFSKIYLENTK